MKNLLYKEMIMFNKSSMLIYTIIFMIFSLILSMKNETMRYTGIIFVLFLVFRGISTYEDKYNGFTIMNTFPVKKTDIPKAKYIFLSIILVVVTSILYIYQILTNRSVNIYMELIIILCVGCIYIAIMSFSYYRSNFKQSQGKLLIIAIVFNVIATIMITLINRTKVSVIFVFIGLILLVFIWNVGAELSIRSVDKVEG